MRRPGRGSEGVDVAQEISIEFLSWAKMGRPSVTTMSLEKRRRLPAFSACSFGT